MPSLEDRLDEEEYWDEVEAALTDLFEAEAYRQEQSEEAGDA